MVQLSLDGIAHFGHAEIPNCPKGDIPLNGIVEVALPYMPRQSPVIIISSLDEDETLRKAISTMRVLEFDVTIISPSSIDFEMMAREHNKDLVKKRQKNM